MSKFVQWVENRFGVGALAPVAPEGFRPAIPESDDDHLADEELLHESDLQGQSFQIEYCDSKGEISNRRITVKGIHRTNDGHLCIMSVCWERSALRGFRADRIKSMSRLSDPTPIKDPAGFFEKYIHDGYTPDIDVALKPLRPGLRVLVYLSRCDGEIHPTEIDSIRKYVGDRAPWKSVENFIEAQHPEAGLAKTMMKSALKNKIEAEKLLTAAKLLIDADGKLAPEEIEGMNKLYLFSERLRYQESIK